MNQSSTPVERVDEGRLRVDNFAFMSSQPLRSFKWLRIDTNDNCNLKCTYCRVPRSQNLIATEDLEQFLNSKVADVNNLQFGCGMEPTLDPRLADLLLLASRTQAKPDRQFVVQTNGTLLHRQDHKKMSAAGLNRLSVSIDSIDENVHRDLRGGSDLKKIIANLREFHQNCPEVDLQFICVVTSANIAGLVDLAKSAVDLGVKRMSFRQMVYVPNHPNTVDADVAPLVVSRDEFEAVKERVEAAISDSMEMSFYTSENLVEHRQTMRADSYYDSNADKPFLAPMMKVEDGTDLLEGKKFFVLRGFMKSGTNWVGRLLNLHPEISCAGEFHWQNVSTALLKNIDRSNLLSQKVGLRHQIWMSADRMMKECMVLANHPAATWVGDRTPVHISPSLIMGSKIFNLVRDGRDVLISRTYHFFNHPQLFPKFAAMPEMKQRLAAFKRDSQFFLKNPNELLACLEFVHDSAFYWDQTINSNEKKLAELEPERFMELRYEAIHRDTDGERARMYSFLGVDPDLAGPLAFNTKPGFEKETPNQFLRKGAVGDWRNYMTPQAKAKFNELAGDTLVRLGYADSLDW